MGFEQHRINLIEWFHFKSNRTDSARNAELLVLGEKEDTEIFDNYLEKRVKRISHRLDDTTYDAIFIPILTKRVLSLFQDDMSRMLHSLTDTWLTPGGSILIGIANEKDLDILCGARKNDNVRYMSDLALDTYRQEIKKAYPDSEDMLYFPMPALEYAEYLYSEDYMPNESGASDKYRAIIRDGQYRAMAPAYFYIFTKPEKASDANVAVSTTDADSKKKSMTPVFIKYNSSRKPEYAIKTMILRDEQGVLHVQKMSLTEVANPHVEAISEQSALIGQENPLLHILEPELVKKARGLGVYESYVQYPYVKGKSLSDILASLINRGEAPIQEIKESMDLVIGRTEGMVNPANLDGLFSNILVQESKGSQDSVTTLIDCEWVIAQDTEVKYLQFRMLKYWYEEHREELKYENLEDFLRHFGFTKKEAVTYDAREVDLQDQIHGEGAQFNSFRYMQSRISLSTYMDVVDEREALKKQAAVLIHDNKEQEITIKKEREVARLTQIHVGNLEHVVKVHERDIAHLSEQLDFYKAHQSMGAKMKVDFDKKYDEMFPPESRKRKLMSYVHDTIRHPRTMFSLYFSEDGRNRIHGDFHIGGNYRSVGKLHFQKTETPLVSIVIPCYNQINYTYNCLHSILENTSWQRTPYEIIIADDVSTDATREIGMYADNLVIARNKENQGFLKNCNQAAALAKGKYIFFLNNDTTVTAGWLDSLVRLIESDDSIGMVGSKLVYPDGRLQEAGGIIWSDGSGWNYGRLQDPSAPEYNYVKEVDYISGAAIMIRTELWQSIEGFDETFAPAYYEDVDLAFEVRRHGKKVMFQPQSVVVHYEGISNGTDTEGTGLKRFQTVNQHKFLTKWEDELKKQSVNTGNPDPFLARERGQDKKYILFIEHYVPTPDRDAGSKLDFQYIELMLSKGYGVKYLGDNFQNEEPYTSNLEQLGVEVLYGASYETGIWDWIEKHESMISIAYLNRPHIASKYIDFLREHTSMKIIYFGCDLHSLRLMREYQLSGDENILEEAEYWKNVEYTVMRKSDMSYFPSIVEEQVIKAEDPSIKVKAITAFIYPERAAIKDNYEEREGLLFVGGFGHPPNKDGVLWFVQNILPRIRTALPDVTFSIVGSHVDSDIQALDGHDGVEVLGFVSDERLAELYQEKKVVVVPLRFGAGIKGKVVDALHEGAAIVTTSVGAEGIPDAETVLRIEDTEDGFASSVISLYDAPDQIRRMSRNASDFIEKNYSPDGAWAILKPDFESGI